MSEISVDQFLKLQLSVSKIDDFHKRISLILILLFGHEYDFW